jgi:AraC-like DNA-binding protein
MKMNAESLGDNRCLSCGCIETNDPAIFEFTSRPWEVLSEPMGARGFLNRKQYAATESVVLYREHFSAPTRLRGMSPVGKLSIVVPLRHGERTRYLGQNPRPAMIGMSYPGVLDAIVDGGDEHLILLIDLGFLHNRLGEQGMERVREVAEQRGIALDPPEFIAFSRWLESILNAACPRARGKGSGMSHISIRKARLNPTKAECLVHRLEDELPACLLSLCENANGRLARPRGGWWRATLVNRALEFLRDGSSTMPSVGDLCQVTGAKQRTLQYAFEERFGLTPVRFIRLHRLHRSRHQLAGADPGSVKVGQVATGLGFRHLSRFAKEYRDLFGELPSQTLERPACGYRVEPLHCASRSSRGCGKSTRQRASAASPQPADSMPAAVRM